MVQETPGYRPLVRGSRYEILSTLSTSPRAWQCRLRVDGSHFLWQPDNVLDVGTVVKHTRAGYVGVVVGWDDACQRPQEWCQLMGVDSLPRGRAQPFYEVLVASGAQAEVAQMEDTETTYVPEDLLQTRAPLSPVEPADQTPLTLPSFLFSGKVDEETGTWEPTPFLRSLCPQGVEGCWMVESVMPDDPPEELAEEAVEPEA